MGTIVIHSDEQSIMRELTIWFDSTVHHCNDVVLNVGFVFLCFHCVCLFIGSLIDPNNPPRKGWTDWGPSQDHEDERKQDQKQDESDEV